MRQTIKRADKKKADYQEGLEKCRAGSAAQSPVWQLLDMKDLRKSLAQIHESYVKNPEKICADSAAWSRESYKKDLENSHDHSTARSCENYLKDPEKNCAWNREGYMKDPEKSHPDSAVWSRQSHYDYVYDCIQGWGWEACTLV